MSRSARVLVVEDLPNWQEAFVQCLKEAGFPVAVASTLEESLDLLESQLFHLILLDLQLDESDQENLDGMELLRGLAPYGLSQALWVIVVTAHYTTGPMQEAFARYGVVDFLPKTPFDAEELVAKVRALVTQKMGINFSLQILWQDSFTPEKAVLNLRIGGGRVKRNSPWQVLLAGELEDLLCRLFHTAQHLIVETLSGGHSGAGVLLVKPFYEQGGARPVVVKFGDFRDIEQEYANFERYVKGWVGGARSTSVYERRRSLRLGGIAYSFLGAGEGQVADFASYYRQSETRKIQRTLDGLFSATCGAWYANPGYLRPLDLTKHYMDAMGMTVESLGRSLESLKAVQGKNTLHFRALAGMDFPSPLPVVASRSFLRSTYEITTHGDLNPYNIFVDDEGHSWLIDFLRTGPGHYLRDIVELDTTIRIELLSEDEATLEERLELERALATARTFSEAEGMTCGQTTNHAIEKAFFICRHLRRLARRLIALHTDGDISEFYVGALFCALNLTRFYSLSTLQREHALLSACVLAEVVTS